MLLEWDCAVALPTPLSYMFNLVLSTYPFPVFGKKHALLLFIKKATFTISPTMAPFQLFRHSQRQQYEMPFSVKYNISAHLTDMGFSIAAAQSVISYVIPSFSRHSIALITISA